MTRRIFAAGIFAVIFAAVSLAADVNGKWQGTISSPNGDVQLTFNFKMNGTKLTGTVETADGDADITSGQVDGNKITFKTEVGGSDVNHEGTVSGDTMQLKVEGPWGTSPLTLKRVPADHR